MSPELASGKPYDRSADVWALGCVLYSLTTLKQRTCVALALGMR